MHDGLDAIKVVFATDDKYIPFLAVAIESLVDNSSKDNYYSIKPAIYEMLQYPESCI